jgi:hypothetical protein
MKIYNVSVGMVYLNPEIFTGAVCVWNNRIIKILKYKFICDANFHAFQEIYMPFISCGVYRSLHWIPEHRRILQ